MIPDSKNIEIRIHKSSKNEYVLHTRGPVKGGVRRVNWPPRTLEDTLKESNVWRFDPPLCNS